MSLDIEISEFDNQCALLSSFVDELALVDLNQMENKHWFLAEAVLFRLYRIYERLVRYSFLHYCVNSQTIEGREVKSKLNCPDLDTAENILKAGNRFLDWGNVESVRKLAELVFKNGFPLVDLVSPIASKLTDLQRFRNFVAHDSKESLEGFKKSRFQYVKLGDSLPETVGKLSLYRKGPQKNITLKIVHADVSKLSAILRAL